MPIKDEKLTMDDHHKSAGKTAASICDHIADTVKKAKKQLDYKTPEAALARAKVFHLAGYFEDAKENYTAALKSKQGDEAAARLAIVNLLTRDPESALATATELASRNPQFTFREVTSDQNVSALTVLGDTLAFSGRVEEAAEAYQRARQTVKDRDHAAAGRLAQIYLATGRPQQAIELRAEVAKNPRFGYLARLLEAGARNPDLLSAFASRPIDRILAVAVHGRPFLAESTAVLAPVAEGDSQWCAEV